MEDWIESTTVKSYETDLHRRWKPSCFFQTMQEVATHHAASWGYDYDSLQAAGRVWVLSRLKIRFDDLPAEGEAVSIRTWPRGVSRRVFFLRDFQFHGPGGRALAVATSAWLLIEPTTRRLLSPQVLAGTVPSYPDVVALPDPLDKLAVPNELPERFTVQAGYSAVDLMGHVNNARYVEWVCDSVPFERYRSARLRWLQVNYSHEVRPDETVSVRAGECDGQWQVYGLNLANGLRAFEAVAAFS